MADPTTPLAAADRRRHGFGWLRRAAPFAVSGVCLVLLIALFQERLPTVLTIVQSAQAGWILVAAAAFLVSLVTVAGRLSIIFGAFGMDLGLLRGFWVTLIGLFFNNFLPTGMGGDVVKAGFAVADTRRVGEVYVATLFDRALGLVGLLAVGCVGLPYFLGSAVSWQVVALPALVVAGSTGVVIAISISNWPERWLDRAETVGWLARLQAPRLARAALPILRSPRALLTALAVSFVAVTLTALTLWSLARAVGLDLGFGVFLLLVPAIMVASLAPSINGLGVRETAIVALLAGRAPETEALALAVLFYGVMVLTSGLGGVVFLLRKPLNLQFTVNLGRRSVSAGD